MVYFFFVFNGLLLFLKVYMVLSLLGIVGLLHIGLFIWFKNYDLKVEGGVFVWLFINIFLF